MDEFQESRKKNDVKILGGESALKSKIARLSKSCTLGGNFYSRFLIKHEVLLVIGFDGFLRGEAEIVILFCEEVPIKGYKN